MTKRWKMMKWPVEKIVVLALVSTAFLLPERWTIANEAKKKANLQLEKVGGEANEKFSIMTIRLSHTAPFSKPEMEDHGTFFQLILPSVVVPYPGMFFDGNSPIVEKIGVFQIGKDAGIRFFVNQSAAKVKEASDIDLLGKRLLITINHRMLKNQKREVAIQKPATKTIEQFESFAATNNNESSLTDKLRNLAFFSAILLLGILAAWFFRPAFKKRFQMQNFQDDIKLRALSHLPLNQKQRLSLIEVAGEKILLAVSHDQVNFITTVQQSDPKPPHLTESSLPNPTHQPYRPIVPKVDPELPTANPKPVASSTVNMRKPVAPSSKALKEYGIDKLAPTHSSSGKIAQQDPTLQKTRKTEAQKTIKKALEKPSLEKNPKIIEDVTQLIREKIKNLPPL